MNITPEKLQAMIVPMLQSMQDGDEEYVAEAIVKLLYEHGDETYEGGWYQSERPRTTE